MKDIPLKTLLPSTFDMLHVEASPFGFVETRTFPAESTATQSPVDGHEMPFGWLPKSKATGAAQSGGAGVDATAPAADGTTDTSDSPVATTASQTREARSVPLIRPNQSRCLPTTGQPTSSPWAPGVSDLA